MSGGHPETQLSLRRVAEALRRRRGRRGRGTGARRLPGVERRSALATTGGHSGQPQDPTQHARSLDGSHSPVLCAGRSHGSFRRQPVGRQHPAGRPPAAGRPCRANGRESGGNHDPGPAVSHRVRTSGGSGVGVGSSNIGTASGVMEPLVGRSTPLAVPTQVIQSDAGHPDVIHEGIHTPAHMRRPMKRDLSW